MFADDEDPCANCVPISPIEFYDRIHSRAFYEVMREFFDGPAQDLMAQMELALMRLKQEKVVELKSKIG